MAIVACLLLLNVSMARAAATFVTDLPTWESMVSDIEVFITDADNVFLADEVTTFPFPNAQPGPTLTFQAVNTGLSRGFVLNALQPGASFTFSETEGGVAQIGFEDALSVGDIDNFEDDDWSLGFLDGASVMALGFEIRHSQFAPGEKITLYSGGDIVGELDLSSLPNTGSDNYFIGILSDVPFDMIVFDEDPDGDDIAVADFRFADIPSVVEAIEAKVNIKPETLQLNSHGRYVLAVISLPEGYDADDILVDTVKISSISGDEIDPPLYAVGGHVIHFYWGGITRLIVKFDRQDLLSLLDPGSEEVTISGQLEDGTLFSGTDTVRVIQCHKKKFNFFRRLHTLYIWNSR